MSEPPQTPENQSNAEPSISPQSPVADRIYFEPEGPDAPMPVLDPIEDARRQARWMREWGSRNADEKAFDD